MLRLRAAVTLVVVVAGLLACAGKVKAQLAITSSSLSFTQDFNTLSATGTANSFSQLATIPGVFAVRESGGTNGGFTTYRADAGTSSTGDLYSYGPSTGTTTDRALGSLASAATDNIGYGFVFRNTTDTTIISASIGYAGEQWRTAGKATADTLSFSFSTQTLAPTLASLRTNLNTNNGSETPAAAAGYIRVTALDFTSPIFGVGASALNGNAAANRTVLTNTITFAGDGLAINDYVIFYFTDIDSSGSGDHALSIDDFNVTFTPAPVPEPTTILAASALGLAGGGALRRLRRKSAVAS